MNLSKGLSAICSFESSLILCMHAWLMFGRSAEVGICSCSAACTSASSHTMWHSWHYVAPLIRGGYYLHKSLLLQSTRSPPCPLLTWSEAGCCKTACHVSCTTHFSSCKICLLLRVHEPLYIFVPCGTAVAREANDGQLAACPMPCFFASPAGRYKLQCDPPQYFPHQELSSRRSASGQKPLRCKCKRQQSRQSEGCS